MGELRAFNEGFIILKYFELFRKFDVPYLTFKTHLNLILINKKIIRFLDIVRI